MSADFFINLKDSVQVNTRARLIICSMVLSTVLAGCGVPASGADPYSSSGAAGSAKAERSVVVTGPVVITGYGPKQFEAGVPFHKQPDGDSAAWLKVNQSMNGSHAAMYMDGTMLPTNIKGRILTALVPASLTAKAGTHMLWVAVKNPDGDMITSNKVKMIAK